MKIVFSLLVITFLSSQALSQISVTAETFNILANSGNSVDVQWGIGNATVDIGQPGGGNIWDFSELTGDISYSSVYLSVESSPFAELFPTADLYRVTTTYNTQTPFVNHYYYENDSSLNQLCQITEPPSTSTHFRLYDQAHIRFEYPASYQDSWSNSYTELNYILDQEYTTQNEVSYEVDAYGTMILPDGIEEEALRIRYVKTGTGLNNGVYYLFWSNSGANVELYWFDYDVPTSGVVTTDDFAFNGPMLTLGVGDSFPEDYGVVNNYPNPFAANFTLSVNLPPSSAASFVLFDSAGRMVIQQQFPRQVVGDVSRQFDTLALAPGIYFGTLRADSFTQTIKLIKSE